VLQNLIKFDHVGDELSYGEPQAFWWGGPVGDPAHMLIQHVRPSTLSLTHASSSLKSRRRIGLDDTYLRRSKPKAVVVANQSNLEEKRQGPDEHSDSHDGHPWFTTLLHIN
jgi:hypothetical protein